MIGARLTAVLKRAVFATPETVPVVLAWTRSVLAPTGKVTFPLHEVALPEATNCLYVAPLSSEYQMEVFEARVPDKEITPVAVGVVALTPVGETTLGGV